MVSENEKGDKSATSEKNTNYTSKTPDSKNLFLCYQCREKMPPTIAHYNGTLIWHPASTPPKLVVTLPSGTLQWHPAMAPRHPAMAPSTQQWHHVHSPKVGRHPSLWHPAMAPSNGTTSTPPKLVITLPPNHSTLQWHPAMAPRPLPQSWPSPSPPTISHYNGTPRKHPAMAPRPLHPAMAPWCHVQSAKVVRRPPPLLEVRTPIAIAIWGTKKTWRRGVLRTNVCLTVFFEVGHGIPVDSSPAPAKLRLVEWESTVGFSRFFWENSSRMEKNWKNGNSTGKKYRWRNRAVLLVSKYSVWFLWFLLEILRVSVFGDILPMRYLEHDWKCSSCYLAPFGFIRESVVFPALKKPANDRVANDQNWMMNKVFSDSKWSINPFSTILSFYQSVHLNNTDIARWSIISWVVPLPSNSHHQDYYTFSRGSL